MAYFSHSTRQEEEEEEAMKSLLLLVVVVVLVQGSVSGVFGDEKFGCSDDKASASQDDTNKVLDELRSRTPDNPTGEYLSVSGGGGVDGLGMCTVADRGECSRCVGKAVRKLKSGECRGKDTGRFVNDDCDVSFGPVG